MNPFNYFEHIFCINLDKRQDRWQDSLKEFKKVGISDKVQRFSAVEKTDGRVGIIKSNLEIVKLAKENNWKNVLVFEDDIKFLSNSLENLSKGISQINEFNWELFYLGANTHNPLEKYSENLVFAKNCYAVHSMAYSNNIYDKFIKYGESVGETIIINSFILDIWLSSVIQTNNKSLLLNPIITTQRESFSDIEQQVVNYKFIEERAKINLPK
jgi:glycosyl transferase family 25